MRSQFTMAFAVVALFGLGVATGRSISGDSLSDEEQEYVTQQVIAGCKAQGGTPAIGMSVNSKDTTVVALCVIGKKGTGV